MAFIQLSQFNIIFIISSGIFNCLTISVCIVTKLKDKTPLPDVDTAPLIVDVEFIETEEDIDIPVLDSFEKVHTSKKYGAVELPKSLTTPKGRARVVTVINQKGGVGKTTTVINIASQLALRGHNILVIDCDSQGNCATGLGVDKSKVRETTRDLILNPESAISARHATAVDKLHLIVGDKNLIGLEQEMLRQLGREKRLTEALEPLLPHYDIILIDTPPSLGLVTINALVASDGLIIPVQTEYFALEGLGKLLNTIKIVQTRLNSNLSIAKLRGEWHEYQSINHKEKVNCLVTYHPAFLLRSPNYKKEAWADLQMLQKKLNDK